MSVDGTHDSCRRSREAAAARSDDEAKTSGSSNSTSYHHRTLRGVQWVSGARRSRCCHDDGWRPRKLEKKDV